MLKNITIQRNKQSQPIPVAVRLIAFGLMLSAMSGCTEPAPKERKFHLVEATIEDIHNAIKTNQITCRSLVQAYIERAAAYNGVCTELVTADGAPIPPAVGYVRTGSPIVFPTETVPASSMLPNLAQYEGLPLNFGRMETTVSDPSLKRQQYGMIVGIPDAGQLNALETLNIRGERSVTCKGAYDAHPSSGPLPAGAPPDCEAFRQQPDALERAAELDAEFGNKPDLQKLPMYCIPFSFKNWYQAKDMRGTGGNDVNFAMDAPPDDSIIVAELRAKGAIIHAVANAAEIGNTAARPDTATKLFVPQLTARSSWGGATCNAYDTERFPGRTSGGSGVSVSANLVVCSICETTVGSCPWPAGHNAVVDLVPTKGLISDGGISSQRINDRAGIDCRTVRDTALVLDALKGFQSRDMFTAIPKALIPEERYASFIIDEKNTKGKPLQGMRIGVVREFMVKHTLNDVAISDQINKEIQSVLRDQLGAELVESVDPLYPDDPDIPNMRYTFQDAFAEILPFNVPEYFFQTTSSGDLEFAVPGHDARTKDYLVKLALGKAPLSDKLNLRRVISGLDNTGHVQFTLAKYLLDRGDKRVTDWASWVANAKWYSDADRAGSVNAVDVQDLRATAGIDRMKMQTVMRLVVLKVMYENDIDAFVNPNVTIPPAKNGFAREPVINNRGANGIPLTPLLGFPEIVVPAGYNRIVYETQFALSPDKRSYIPVTGTVRSLLDKPLPISIAFWAGAGEEPTLIKVASAYQAATKHRTPPPAFGPLPGEP